VACAELARLADHRPGLLRYARRWLGAGAPPAADELLGIAALWAAFAGDD
jgi:hypothetical protein